MLHVGTGTTYTDKSEYPLYQAYSYVLEWYATLVLSVALALHCSQNSTLNTKLHAQQSFQSITSTLWGKIFALVNKGYYVYLTLPLIVDFTPNNAIIGWCLNLERGEALSVTTKSVSEGGISSGEQVRIHRVSDGIWSYHVTMTYMVYLSYLVSGCSLWAQLPTCGWSRQHSLTLVSRSNNT